MDQDRRAILEAIAYGDDATPADRLKALELLGQEGGGNPAVMLLAQFVLDLSDEQLDRELAGFMDPGFQHTPASYRQDVEREAQRMARTYLAEGIDAAERLANKGRSDKRRRKGKAQPEPEPERSRQEPQRDQGAPPVARIDGYGAFHTHVPPGVDPEDIRRQWGPKRPPRF